MTDTTTVTRDQETLIRDNMALVGHMVRGMLFKVPAHVHRDEMGAPEFFTGGAKLIALSGRDGKLEAASLRA